MSEVINISKAPKGWETNPAYAYIGRAGHGMLGYFGNPISPKAKCLICGVIHGLPGSTLECYESYLTHRLCADSMFHHRFHSELTGKILVCPGNCKIGYCHGNIILRYLKGV